MKYSEGIAKAMEALAQDEKSIFLGEGLINAGRIYGTLDGVSTKKCIEYPIVENLIVGSAIGLAIEGWRPIVVFQRMDFMLCAADAIINHLALIPTMSGDRVKLPVIIRAIIGSEDKKFDVGLQHNKNLVYIFERYINTHLLGIGDDSEAVYAEALKDNKPRLIVEYRDMYDKEVVRGAEQGKSS